MSYPIRLIEVMGRHAGWLPGAAWLARQTESDAPHLVYLPERPRAPETMVNDVREVYDRLKAAGVAMKVELGVQGPALVFQCFAPDNIPVEVRAPKDS